MAYRDRRHSGCKKYRENQRMKKEEIRLNSDPLDYTAEAQENRHSN